MTTRILSLPLVLGLCLGIINAIPTAMAETSLAADACATLSLNECRDLIDEHKIVGVDAGAILRAAALSHLNQSEPDEAILFLTVAESREPNNSVTNQLWGDAYVMRGELSAHKKGEIAPLETQAEYIKAAEKYAAGLQADPNSLANFRGAILASTHSGYCDITEFIYQAYVDNFRDTPEHAELAEIVKEKCGH